MDDYSAVSVDRTDSNLDNPIGSVFFIGNATVLLRFGNFTILTDPTFIHMHEETWLGYGLSTKRIIAIHAPCSLGGTAWCSGRAKVTTCAWKKCGSIFGRPIG